MKKLLIIGLIGCFIKLNLNAQQTFDKRVVWQDDFETSKGWTEYEDETGMSVVKDGILVIKSNEGLKHFSRCKTTIDCNKNFTISAEVKPKHSLEAGHFIGIIFDYGDNLNYKVFFVEKGFVWFHQYVEGQLVRSEKDYLKNQSNQNKKKRGKEEPRLTFEIQKKGQSVLFLVNDEETIEMDDIVVKSNRIGFMVSQKQEVSFDNVKIMQ